MFDLWLWWVLTGMAAGCLAFAGVEIWWARKRVHSPVEDYTCGPAAMSFGVTVLVCCVLSFAWLGWLFEQSSR